MELRKFIRDESALEIKAEKISEGARYLAAKLNEGIWFNDEERKVFYKIAGLAFLMYAALC